MYNVFVLQSFFLVLLLSPFCYSYNKITSHSQQTSLSSPSLCEDGALKVALHSPMATLDPHARGVDTDFQVHWNYFETLFSFAADKSVEPLLATSATRDKDDPLIWKIKLKKNVYFHNGDHFTKHDVLWTLRRMWLAKDYYAASGGYASWLDATLNWEEIFSKNDVSFAQEPTPIESPSESDYEFIISTKVKTALLPSVIASTLIMSAHEAYQAIQMQNTLTQIGSNKSDVSKSMMSEYKWTNGTGPFVFKSVDEASKKVTLIPNFKYHGKISNEYKMIAFVELIPEKDNKDKLLLDGQVNIIAKPTNISTFQHSKKYSTFSDTGLRVFHIQYYQRNDNRQDIADAFVPLKYTQENVNGTLKGQKVNDGHTFFFDSRMRKAFHLAVDRDKLVRKVLPDRAQPTSQYILPNKTGHLDKDENDNPILQNDFDLDEARSLFTKVMEERGLAGKRLVLTIQGPSGRYPKDEQTLTEVARQMTEAFGNVTIGGKKYSLTVVAQSLPKNIFFRHFKQYMVAAIGGGIDNGHVSGALKLYFTTQAPLNIGNFSMEDIDEAYSLAIGNENITEANEIYDKAMTLIYANTPLTPLYNFKEEWAAKKGVKLTPRLDGMTRLSSVQWACNQ